MSTGIAGLNLDSSGNPVNGNLIPTASMFESSEPRSSSAMAEYRVDSLGSVRASLPHSISSPTLTVLNQAQAQPNTLVGSSNNGGGFGSGAASLAASQQNLRALLPAYRPAPDYETAVRIKYGDDIAQLLINPAPPVQQPVQQPVQPPIQQLTPAAVQPSVPILFPAQQQQSSQQQQMQMMKMYKPPPPYPYSKVGSNSSPDLAVAANGVVTANSGSMSQLPVTQAQTEVSTTLRNGEPIYQNIPLRQPGSQPNLSPSTSAATQVASQPRRKWGLPVRSSARSAVISRVQTDSPSSSPASKRSTNESTSSLATHHSTGQNSKANTNPTMVKDHLVIQQIFHFHLLKQHNILND